MDFFLQGLQPDGPSNARPVDRLLEMIEQSFGSFGKFQESFVAHATSLFGSGWVWLVRQGEAEEDGRLRISSTFNGGTPMFGMTHAGSFGQSAGRSGTSLSNASLFAYLAQGRQQQPPKAAIFPFPSADTNTSHHLPSNDIESVLSEPKPTLAVKKGDIPIVGLNLWEHAYILDYGIDKEAYVRRFLQHINWNRAAVILDIY